MQGLFLDPLLERDELERRRESSRERSRRAAGRVRAAVFGLLGGAGLAVLTWQLTRWTPSPALVLGGMAAMVPALTEVLYRVTR